MEPDVGHANILFAKESVMRYIKNVQGAGNTSHAVADYLIRLFISMILINKMIIMVLVMSSIIIFFCHLLPTVFHSFLVINICVYPCPSVVLSPIYPCFFSI